MSPDFAAAQDYRWNKSVTGSSPNNGTLFSVVVLDDTTNEITIVGQSNSGDNNPLWRLEHRGTGIDSTGFSFQFRDNASTLWNESVGSVATAGVPYVVVGVQRGSGSSTQMEIWVNGVLRSAPDIVSFGAITLNQTEVGALVRGSPVQYWDGAISLAGIAARAWSPDEILAFSRNPWQIFEPIEIFGFKSSSANYTLTAAQGSFALTGNAATLTAQRRLTAAQASFMLTGNAANLTAQRLLTAAHGSFTLTGQDATLTPSGANTLTAATGSFALTGNAANLMAQRLLTAEQASFTLTGQAANLNHGYYLQAAAGSFALTGQAATLIKQSVLTGAHGSFTLTGQAATLTFGGAGGGTCLDEIVEGTYTMGDVMRAIAAVLLGKSTGLDTGTATFRNLLDTLDRVSATHDSQGNRSSVTITNDP